MKIVTKSTEPKSITSGLMESYGRTIQVILALASWILLILMVLLTALLAGWVLLAVVLLGGLTPSQPVPVIPILLILIFVTAGLVWLVARYVSSPRSVSLAIMPFLAILFIVGVTWTLSAPDQALFLARDMAWDGTDVRQVQLFPVRTISNALPAFHFQHDPSPQLFDTITYKLNGQSKQISFDDFLKSSQTTSFIVLKDNEIRYEGYFNGYTRDSIVTSFSIAKSFTSALVGIAIDEGYIKSMDDPIIYYLPELRNKGLNDVTIRHLLTMSTGIRYIHGHELPPFLRPLPFNDDSWTTDFPNLRGLALTVQPDGEIPGSAWKYNNYYPQLLGMILERTTHQSVSEYLQEKIWKPLGMEYPGSWSLDSQESGFEKMEQGINARAIDFAKFGVLFLNNGNWNGKEIIPKQWVIESTSPDLNDNRPWRVAADWKDVNGYYKYMWWGQVRPDGSYVYMARGGLQQQWIYVFPKERVVIVRFGLVEGGADSWPDVFESLVSNLK